MTDDLCDVCGKREGENHDLPGRCNPRMAKISEREVATLRADLERMRRERDDAINQRKFGAVMAQRDYEEQVATLRAEVERITAERDRLDELAGSQSHGLRIVGALQSRMERAEAEVERMRPVVEAAKAWRDDDLPFDGGHRGLVHAVDAYRATSEWETTDE